MIKNKELLELIEKKKNEVSCENCIYCNLNEFHRGQWYCNKRSVFDVPIIDIEKCFQRRTSKRKTDRS